MSGAGPRRWAAAALNIGAVVLVLVAANFLPPDTSLAEREKSGVLKICVPQGYPPLVTGDADFPGYDVELAQRVAHGLGLRLVVNVLPSIGRDFNPRNWQVTRAQCDLIAGGVADTVQTRGFLSTLRTGAETGWVLLAPQGFVLAPGSAVAVMPGASGLDRLALSASLRQAGLRIVPVHSVADLVRALDTGQAEAAITERFIGQSAHEARSAWSLTWLTQDGSSQQKLSRYQLAFGLWKGDETLKRALAGQLAKLADSGAIEALKQRYHLAPLPAASLSP